MVRCTNGKGMHSRTAVRRIVRIQGVRRSAMAAEYPGRATFRATPMVALPQACPSAAGGAENPAKENRIGPSEPSGSVFANRSGRDRIVQGVRLGRQPRVRGDPSAVAQVQQEACIGVQSAELAQSVHVLLGRNALKP
jgi:hypothetical protein